MRGFVVSALRPLPTSGGSCAARCGGLAPSPLCAPAPHRPDFLPCACTRYWLSHESLACFFHRPVVFPSTNTRRRVCFPQVDADSRCAARSLRGPFPHAALLRVRVRFCRVPTACVPGSGSRAVRRRPSPHGHLLLPEELPLISISGGAILFGINSFSF